MVNENFDGEEDKKIKRKKFIFWTILILLTIIAFLSLLLHDIKNTGTKTSDYVTAGICGCIKHRGVYYLPEGSDLSMLIQSAGGIKPNGDLRDINTSIIIMHDSVYNIPCRNETITSSIQLRKIQDIDVFKYLPPVEETVNILYIGLPAVYFIINYSLTYSHINIVYIPHSTVLLDNEYRILDLYFTLGIKPTTDIVSKRLSYPVNYYYVQNKNSFIDMIDALGGLDVYVDTVFARANKLKTGFKRLNGWYIYEYISFIDRSHYSSSGNTKSLEDLKLNLKNIQIAYDERQFRQKQVIGAIHRKIKELSITDNKTIFQIIKKGILAKAVETNIMADDAYKILKSLLNGKTAISFITLPGYYSEYGNKTYYYFTTPLNEILKNETLKKQLKTKTDGKEQILY